MTFVSYAQHGEDVILWRALGDRPRVTYVDVGAYDPTDESVTRALYERGWRGANLEPEPGRIERFERDRPEDVNLALAAGDEDGTTVLLVQATPGWSTIQPAEAELRERDGAHEVEVPVRRLGTLLPELGLTEVDVLKIDVEGAEPAVVRGLLAGTVRPTVCVVEGVAPGHGRVAGDQAVELLVAAGYRHCMFDGLNHYLTTEPDLVPALSVPASPVDDYIRYSVAQLIEDRQHLVATIQALAGEAPPPPPGFDVPDNGGASKPVVGERGSRNGTPPAPGYEASPSQNDKRGVGIGVLPPPTAEPVVDPSLRLARRRRTFARLLSSQPGVGVVAGDGQFSADAAPESATLDLDALEAGDPTEAVTTLYQTILGRDPEPEGSDTWSAHLRSGLPLLVAARALAGSEEARSRSAAHRASVARLLRRWTLHSALRDLGIRPVPSPVGSAVADEIFVEALFEVALRRPPSEAELAAEVARLAAGAGRGRAMQAFARRPEPRARLLGARRRSPVALLRRWRGRLTYYADFRAMVLAAESRRIEGILRAADRVGEVGGDDTSRGL